MATRAEARDAAFGPIKAVLDSLSIPTVWDGTFAKPPNSTSVRWAWVRLLHAQSDQRAIGTSGGKRLYGSVALLTVEVRTKMALGISEADSVGEAIQKAIVGARVADIGFENATVREVGIEDGWWRTDVTADVEYYSLL